VAGARPVRTVPINDVTPPASWGRFALLKISQAAVEYQ